MSAGVVPRLDLAPKRTKPLSLWNPLDYLVLLYWCFFFPQALRWYEERFCNKDIELDREKFLTTVSDPVRRRLALQATLTLILGLTGIGIALLEPTDLLAWLIVSGVAVGVAGGVARGAARGVVQGVAGGLIFGAAFSLALSPFGLTGCLGCATVVVALGVALGVGSGVASDVASGVARGVTPGVAVGVARGVAACMPLCLVVGLTLGLVVGMAFGVALIVFACRIPEWVLALHASYFGSDRHWSRMVWLPLSPLQERLELWLNLDWEAGVSNVNSLLRYTLQFIPILAATNRALEQAKEEKLLDQVCTLAKNPFDWSLIRFNSARLGNAIGQATLHGIIPLPRKFREKLAARYPIDLRLDTPARCACAGFWLWHDGDTTGAATAFAKVRDLPRGSELHAIADAIVKSKSVERLGDFVVWKEISSWLETPSPEALRPATIAALCELRAVALEAVTADQANAPLNRSGALGRAAAQLNAFISADPESRPEPEGPILTAIAKRWLGVILEAGGSAGEAILRQPTPNPYEGYSGLPVLGPSFASRADILRRIETLWAASEVLPTIFLYGHRRMGKTSILRYLEATVTRETLVIYLDMQDIGWVENTAEFLRDIAEAIHKKTVAAGLDSGEPPSSESYQSHDRARRSINGFLDHLDSQLQGRRLILAIDEFELIEEGIEKGRIDPGLLPWLRSRAQRHRWLGILFGGLHTLEEMGGDYRRAFYSQTENVRVTYLSRQEFTRLVTQPHPDFSLEYAADLVDQIYHLTHGQPFLVQRLCWELVTQWNERFLEQGETTPRLLTLADLDSVLDSDFFKNAEYYFAGVWKNVSESERRLMNFLATREASWSTAELAATGLGDLEDVLRQLSRHDVILESDGEIRFASELMRRWVALQSSGQPVWPAEAPVSCPSES